MKKFYGLGALFLIFLLLPACEKEKVVKIAGGFKFADGLAADAEGNIFFSDIPAKRIHKWSIDGKLSTFLENSVAANGLFFDKEGNLVACEAGERRIVSIDPTGNVELIADNYNGKPLNGPKDLWIDPKGGIYFTDPRYERRASMEQEGENVYYITPHHKKVILVIDDLLRPDGIIGTPDGKMLYVSDRGANNTYRYIINEDGTLSEKKLFVNDGSQGMAMDSIGTVYFTEGAVFLYDASGNNINKIIASERASDVAFGGRDRQTLFIVGQSSLYSVRIKFKGL